MKILLLILIALFSLLLLWELFVLKFDRRYPMGKKYTEMMQKYGKPVKTELTDSGEFFQSIIPATIIILVILISTLILKYGLILR